MKELNFKTTADLKVPKKIIDQVIGQEEGVKIIKKAAQQRRHVLLIGEPGTGKSMLGMGLAELLPKETLTDTISFPNPNDENQPLVRTVPASTGRDLVAKSKLESAGFFKPQNIILFILVLLAMFAPWWILNRYQTELGATAGAIMFTAFFLGGMIFLGAFVLFINLGKRMDQKTKAPKLIVDNFKKKQAPFFDATGAHAGALLGDVLHDPFQTLLNSSKLYFTNNDSKINTCEINKKIDPYFKKHDILRKDNQNYEAIFLKKNELSVLGETGGSVSPVEVLSSNRYDYDGEMIKLTTSENKELIVTPEHKIAINKNGKIAYVEARKIKERDEVVARSDDIIIDEQDIINTYSKEQQALAKSYYDYVELRKQHPLWGYKRIATKLGVSYGRTRWWWEKDSAPVPVQTVQWLTQKGLLPLKIDNPKLPLIAKVLGATFGDGGIFDNLNGIFLSSSEKEAVEEFGRDIENVFELEKNQNSRVVEGGEKGHSWCYQNTNRNIIRMFLALRAPRGNKTKLNLEVPSWISLNDNFENEFFGSFLGGEMTSPIIQKNRTSLSCMEVGVTGTDIQRENRIAFLNKVKNYLYRKRVLTTSIYEGNTNNPDLRIYRLLFSKKYDNVIQFMMNVKINYCKYKVERLYAALAKFTTIKKNMYDHLIKKGMGAEAAMNKLRLTPNSLYLILNFFEEKPQYAKL